MGWCILPARGGKSGKGGPVADSDNLLQGLAEILPEAGLVANDRSFSRLGPFFRLGIEPRPVEPLLLFLAWRLGAGERERAFAEASRLLDPRLLPIGGKILAKS